MKFLNSLCVFLIIGTNLYAMHPGGLPAQSGRQAAVVEPYTCPICLDVAGTANQSVFVWQPCGHRFCQSCIADWLPHDTCPTCRCPFSDGRWILEITIDKSAAIEALWLMWRIALAAGVCYWGYLANDHSES